MLEHPPSPLAFNSQPISLKPGYPIAFESEPLNGHPPSWSIKTKEDFTIFVKAPDFYRALRRALKHWPDDLEERHSFDFDQPVTLWLNDTFCHRFQGRVHAVRCCKSGAFSITLRSLTSEASPTNPGTGLEQPRDISNIDRAFNIATKAWDTTLDSTIGRNGETVVVGEPLSDPLDFHRKSTAEELLTFCTVSKFLSPKVHSDEVARGQLFPESGLRPSGLVLISGETGCGKTTFLNGLLRTYWQEHVLKREKPRRRPHMLVIGDPIETTFYKALGPDADRYHSTALCQEALGEHRLFDVTERVLGIDTPSVADALQDALRETPKVVVVSELRRNEDFEAALNFAATGHLIFSTSHNTSLVDTMSKLMRIMRVHNPGHRAMLAQRILGIVHLVAHEETVTFWKRNKRGKITGSTDKKLRANVPLVWRSNTKAGVRNFVSEGLSSMYPRSPRGDPQNAPVLGRAWFIEELRRLHKESNHDESAWTPLTADGVDPFDLFRNSMQALDLHSY